MSFENILYEYDHKSNRADMSAAGERRAWNSLTSITLQLFAKSFSWLLIHCVISNKPFIVSVITLT